MNKKILIVVAHSDDEALGCGGTILKHSQMKEEVRLLVIADGVSSRDDSSGKAERNSALRNSCDVLGIKEYKQLNFSDNKLDTLPLLAIVKEIEKFMMEAVPDVVYTHAYNDLNIDHSIVHKAVITACRPQFSDFYVSEIYSFYVPSSTEWISKSMGEGFSPNKFVDIEQYFDKKIEALKCYHQEMREYPHPRSYRGVENLASYFGNSVGLDKAECFMVERIVDRKNE